MLLMGVLRRLLMTAEMDARRLRRKNFEALRLAIQLLEPEAAKEAAAKAKAARHVKEQDRLLHRLTGMLCSFDGDDGDASTMSGSDDEDDDAPPHIDAYTKEGHNGMDDWKGKGAARKW
ncbi:Polygalacturonase ADPG1 [Hordeum vulgare]|nr:Polygalacturonase ADPG1 [Hordeum vulgare]